MGEPGPTSAVHRYPLLGYWSFLKERAIEPYETGGLWNAKNSERNICTSGETQDIPGNSASPQSWIGGVDPLADVVFVLLFLDCRASLQADPEHC